MSVVNEWYALQHSVGVWFSNAIAYRKKARLFTNSLVFKILIVGFENLQINGNESFNKWFKGGKGRTPPIL